jgi:L-cysteine:1D-myo-inositol 2-amino-2-deoxy-alpha-D-glucopyranoside ligase
MPEATTRLEAWRAGGDGDGPIDAVRAALDDDLDTSRAIQLIDEAAAAGQGVSAAAALLGVD